MRYQTFTVEGVRWVRLPRPGGGSLYFTWDEYLDAIQGLTFDDIRQLLAGTEET